MVDIRPSQLNPAITPLREDDVIIVDQGVSGINKASVLETVNSISPVASQSEAVAGADNTKRMTPLRTKQSIASEVGVTLASNTQGAKADSSVQSVNGKTGNSVTLVKGDVGLGNVDNTSDLDKPISTATQAALDGKASSAQGAKADSAVQAAGGSTGQVLTKNSNTDNDVAWQTVAAATAVSYAPQTLTGAQQGQAIANIGAGVLSGFRNKIINGNFDFWQRGISQTVSGYGSDDRWKNIMNATGARTNTQGIFDNGQTAVPGNPVAFSKTTITIAPTDADGYVLKQQSIEDVRTLSGKKATLTFYAKASASLKMGIEVSQWFGDTGSASVFGVLKQPVTLTTSWKKFTFAFDIPSISGKTLTSGHSLIIHFWLSAGSAYNDRASNIGIQTGTFDIARVSLVEGDATAEEDPFSPRHEQQELALCQRYYEKLPGGANIGGTNTLNGNSRVTWTFKERKRTIPTITNVGGAGLPDGFSVDQATIYLSGGNPAFWFGGGATADAEL